MKKFTHKSVTKVLSFVLVVLMLFISFSAGVSALSTGVLTTNEDKLTNNLKTHLETVGDDEYVPIYIWLTDYDEDMFYAVLSKRLGTTITEQTEEAYITNRISSKIELFKQNYAVANENIAQIQADVLSNESISTMSALSFRAQANIANAMSDTEIETCISSGMSATEIISLSERSQYLSDYRQSRKALNNAVTQDFFKKLDLSKCQNVYLDSALKLLILDSTKSYISTLSNMEQVQSIDLYQEVEYTTSDVTEDSEISDVELYGEYHMTEQYSKTGAGIKIGVLETGSRNGEEITARYDSTLKTLEGKTIITNIPSECKVADHASKVLSLLCGNEILYNGVSYQGIAPKASVFYTNLAIYDNFSTRFSEGLNWLIVTNVVDIVTMSFGNYNSNSYSNDWDKIVDEYAFNYRVVFVIASGNVRNDLNNTGQVISPAYAYNAITVGNATAKLSIFEESCYDEPNYLTNKPDISAFGTNICMATSDTEMFCDSGTSFAAPMVAGAAALVMQANPDLIGKPAAVKAILLGSADENAISVEATTDENNNVVENNGIVSSCSIANNSKIQSATPILREKSGAGLLNIEAAIRMANSNLVYEFSISSGTIHSIFTETYYFNAGETIEFGLVFEKVVESYPETVNKNDIDIRILDADNNLVFASSDYVNNVEIFKCTFAESGEYKFTLFCWEADVLINIALFLSCGCNEKMLSRSNFTDALNTISCSNTECGFSCIEKYRLLQSTKTAYNGITVTLSKYYLPYKIGYSVTGFEQESDLVASYNNTNTSVIVRAFALSYNYSLLTPTGKITTRSYELVLELSDGTIVTTEETFVVTADYFDQTLSIS